MHYKTLTFLIKIILGELLKNNHLHKNLGPIFYLTAELYYLFIIKYII